MRRYVDLISMAPRTLVALLVISTFPCLKPASRLMDATQNVYSEVEGSGSQIARRRLKELFGREALECDILLVESRFDLIASGVLEELTEEVEDFLHVRGLAIDVMGYAVADRRGLPQVAQQLIAADHRSSVIVLARHGVPVNRTVGIAEHDLVDHLKRVFFSGTGGLTFIGIAGIAPFVVEGVAAATNDLRQMTPISMPLCFIALTFALRSCRLMTVPLLCMFCANTICFGILDILAEYVLVMSTSVPSLVEVLLIALTFDYSLFLLMRFRDEVTEGTSVTEAVITTLLHSGSVVLGSGLTLCYCVLTYLVLPVDDLKSVSIGSFLAILTAMGVSLLLTPALLLAFPIFFAGAARDGESTRVCPNPSNSETEALHVQPKGSRLKSSTCWRQWAAMCTTPGCSAAAALMFLVVAGFAYGQANRTRTSADLFLIGPRSSMTRDTLSRVGRAFGVGDVGPVTILLSASGCIDDAVGGVGAIYDEACWASATSLLEQVDNELLNGTMNGTWTGSITSVMYMSLANKVKSKVPKLFVEFVDSQNLTALPPKMANDVRELEYVMKQSLNKDRSAAIAIITPSIRTTSLEAEFWTKRLRTLIAAHNADQSNSVEAYVFSQTAEVMDVAQAVHDHLPRFIIVSLLGCVIIVGLLFRSVLLAVRGIVSIAFTLGTVYVVAVGIFQFGWFADAVPLGGTEGLFFMVPVMTFTIVVGLALDYDIFLLGRVVELREAGLSTIEAVVEGTAQTGHVITCAGIIMAIAFGGLLVSDTPSLKQTSFILVCAVLLDTFVVRTIVTPALMAALGEANWWPREFLPLKPDDKLLLAELDESSTETSILPTKRPLDVA